MSYYSIQNLLVIASLFIIILMTFGYTLISIYNYEKQISEIAVNEALIKINNAIQQLYLKPHSSIKILITLPPSEWIKMEENKIKCSKKIIYKLYDENSIIDKIENDTVFYKNIKFNPIIINGVSELIIINEMRNFTILKNG